MKPTLGVIMSDTQFSRPVGDVGNPDSYDCPVIFHVARGVTAEMMVRAVPNAELLEPYLEGAIALQRRGAGVITCRISGRSCLSATICRPSRRRSQRTLASRSSTSSRWSGWPCAPASQSHEGRPYSLMAMRPAFFP
jgi:hypothetical protein